MAEVGSASVRIVPDLKGFGAATAAGVKGSLGQTAATARTVGLGLTAAVTLPVLAVGAAAVKSFGEFDQAITESLAIVQDFGTTTRADFEDTAREVAKSTKFTASEVGESFFFLASAGLTAEQQIGALPAVAAFAQAGMFDMATATDLATDAQSALGLTVPDTQQNLENLIRVTDVLVGANTLANASVEQFSLSLTTKAGTALKILNKDMEEGVAVLSLYADKGIKGTLAGELLSRTLKFLNIRAVENKEEFDRLGIAVFDASGKMNNVADIADDLTAALGDMSDEERTAALNALGFTGRTQDAILTLIGGGAAIRSYEAALKSMGGITQTVADRQLQSFSAKMSLIKSRIADVAISLGQQLAPVVLTITGAIAKLVELFAAAPAPIKRFVGAIAVIGALAGPVLLIGGSLAKAFIAIRSLGGGATRGAAQASAYAAAQTRAAAATSALAGSAGRATVAVRSLSSAQLAPTVIGRPGGPGGIGPVPVAGAGTAVATATAGGFLARNRAKAGLSGANVAKAAGLAFAGDFAGSLIQGISTQEGTVGDKVKDTLGNAVRGAGIGAAVGSIVPGVGTAIGAGVGAAVGGVFGFFSSNKGEEVVETAVQAARTRITDVISGMELSEREELAAAAILDGSISRIVNLGVEAGLGGVEAAALGDQAEEVVAALLERGIDPDRIGELVDENVADGLQQGLSPEQIADNLARGEQARTEALANNIIDPDALEEFLAEEIPDFSEVFREAIASGADIIPAFQAAFESGAAGLDLTVIGETITAGISDVPSIFERTFEKGKEVSTAKMVELARDNVAALGSFKGNIQEIAESGMVALAATLEDKGDAAAAVAFTQAENIADGFRLEASLRGIAEDDIEAFLTEFADADVETLIQAFIDRFVDPIAAGRIKEAARLEALAAQQAFADNLNEDLGASLAGDFVRGVDSTIRNADGQTFAEYSSRMLAAAQSSLGSGSARDLAEGFVSTIDRTVRNATISAPTVQQPRAPTTSTFDPAPPFAEGGRIRGLGLVGEKGPEIFSGTGRIFSTDQLREALGVGRETAVTAISRTTNITINNPSVRDASRDAQKAALLDRLAGVA